MAADEALTGPIAAKEAVAGEDCLRAPKPCTTKRKAVAVDECSLKVCATRRKVEAAAIGPCEGKGAGDAAVAPPKGEEAPGKKMARLPEEEIEWLLAQVDDGRAPRSYENLRRKNPDLLPSPEEEMDEATVLLYDEARDFYASTERFFKFQAWVRSEYEKYGYVEVDEDEYPSPDQVQAWSDEARAEAFRDILLSETDDKDDAPPTSCL